MHDDDYQGGPIDREKAQKDADELVKAKKAKPSDELTEQPLDAPQFTEPDEKGDEE